MYKNYVTSMNTINATSKNQIQNQVYNKIPTNSVASRKCRCPFFLPIQLSRHHHVIYWTSIMESLGSKTRNYARKTSTDQYPSSPVYWYYTSNTCIVHCMLENISLCSFHLLYRQKQPFSFCQTVGKSNTAFVYLSETPFS